MSNQSFVIKNEIVKFTDGEYWAQVRLGVCRKTMKKDQWDGVYYINCDIDNAFVAAGMLQNQSLGVFVGTEKECDDIMRTIINEDNERIVTKIKHILENYNGLTDLIDGIKRVIHDS